MSEFQFNHTSIDEENKIPLTNGLAYCIRNNARKLLVPYFRKVCITYESEGNHETPVLTSLAESIIQSVYDRGELSISAQLEAEKIGLQFLNSCRDWELETLAFYFCTDPVYHLQIIEESEELEDITEDEEFNIEVGRILKNRISILSKDKQQLASRLPDELIHLQDIFSTEDINSWDAGAISFANENFETYAGKGQVLIALPISDFDYWEKFFKDNEEEEDEEE